MSDVRDDVMAMPAGREIDALVAEKVMGDDIGVRPEHTREAGGVMCSRCGHVGDNWEYSEEVAQDAGPCEVEPMYYSTDIGHAWKVIEAMIARRRPGSFGGRDPVIGVDGKGESNGKPYVSWWCSLSMDDDDAVALTAPLAICRAALVAVAADADRAKFGR